MNAMNEVRVVQSTESAVLRAAVAEYNRADGLVLRSQDEAVAVRRAITSMMVGLGLFNEFTDLVEGGRSRLGDVEVIGRRTDGSPIVPYAPDGGPV